MKVDMTNVSENSVNTSDLVYKYMRPEHLPHIWCPGCGNGIIMHAVAQAMENAGVDRNKTVIVSGIGCSSRAAGYMDCNTIHTTHGRAIAFATGIKMANPELEVIVITGDGDSSAIGGNHLIHAARRNVGITVVVVNNNIYGMTGGQYSPTTPTGSYGTTAPYGNLDRNFKVADLALAAGATYAARSTVYHTPELTKLIEGGIKHQGFGIIEVVSICPTYYGRKNKVGGPVEMMQYIKENTVPFEKAKGMTRLELKRKYVTGLFNKEDHLIEYSKKYELLIEAIKQAGDDPLRNWSQYADKIDELWEAQTHE